MSFNGFLFFSMCDHWVRRSHWLCEVWWGSFLTPFFEATLPWDGMVVKDKTKSNNLEQVIKCFNHNCSYTVAHNTLKSFFYKLGKLFGNFFLREKKLQMFQGRCDFEYKFFRRRINDLSSLSWQFSLECKIYVFCQLKSLKG